MTIFTVESWYWSDGSVLDKILTDEAEALAIRDADEALRLAANKDEPDEDEEPDAEREVRTDGTRVTCWRLIDGRYVKDETWPGDRS